MTEHVLIPLLSRAENHKLKILLAYLIHHTVDEVKSFLISEPGDNTDHELVLVLFQAEFLLKSYLVLPLFFPERDLIVTGRNLCIRLRIKELIVDTVDDSGQAVAAGPHQSVQVFTVKRCLDFLSICRRYSRDPVSIHNAALKIVGISIRLQLV